jgi:hypothetical protein
MRIAIVLALVGSLGAASGCRKDAGTTDPGSEGDLLGIDAGAKSSKRTPQVSMGCIQDPADPACDEILGVTRSSAGEIEFTGDACRTNLCSGHGTCELDTDGFVTCVCEAGASGEHCDRRKR